MNQNNTSEWAETWSEIRESAKMIFFMSLPFAMLAIGGLVIGLLTR